MVFAQDLDGEASYRHAVFCARKGAPNYCLVGPHKLVKPYLIQIMQHIVCVYLQVSGLQEKNAQSETDSAGLSSSMHVLICSPKVLDAHGR